jgi:serine/threonine protein kinase
MDPGTLLAGRYRIEAALASGGMGVVYSATQLPLNRSVAIKVLRRELLKHGPFLARLRREAQTVARLKHPNIINITDLVLEEDLAFFVMDLLQGESFGTRIAKPQVLDESLAANLGCQVLAALEVAHGVGLVHRDVKPDNIFLVDPAKDGLPPVAKLLDFGLVKNTEQVDDRLTADHAVLGTWQYMPPEQARGEEADARADLYALGACLYYALTKMRPYQAAKLEPPTFALSDVPAPDIRTYRPDLSPTLAATIHQALDKDRLRRFQSAREMADALARSCSRMMPFRRPTENDQPSVLDDPTAAPLANDGGSEEPGARVAAIHRAIGSSVVLQGAAKAGSRPLNVVDARELRETTLQSSNRSNTANTGTASVPSSPISTEVETQPLIRELEKNIPTQRTSSPTQIDPRRAPAAYEPTVDVLPTEQLELPSQDLVSAEMDSIESVELRSIPANLPPNDANHAAASRLGGPQWSPPQKLRAPAVLTFQDSSLASGVPSSSRGDRETPTTIGKRQQDSRRRLAWMFFFGALVFLSGLLLGQFLVK